MRKKIIKILSLVASSLICLGTMTACDLFNAFDFLKPNISENPNEGQQGFQEYVIINDFDSKEDWAKLGFKYSLFGKTSINKDKNYITSGEGSLKIEAQGMGTGDPANGIPKFYIAPSDYSTESIKYEDFANVKEIICDVYNANDVDKTITLALEMGGQKTVEKTYVLPANSWEKIVYEVNYENVSVAYAMNNVENIEFGFEPANIEEGTPVLYMDKLTFRMAETQQKTADMSLDNGEILSFDKEWQEYACLSDIMGGGGNRTFIPRLSLNTDEQYSKKGNSLRVYMPHGNVTAASYPYFHISKVVLAKANFLDCSLDDELVYSLYNASDRARPVTCQLGDRESGNFISVTSWLEPGEWVTERVSLRTIENALDPKNKQENALGEFDRFLFVWDEFPGQSEADDYVIYLDEVYVDKLKETGKLEEIENCIANFADTSIVEQTEVLGKAMVGKANLPDAEDVNDTALLYSNTYEAENYAWAWYSHIKVNFAPVDLSDYEFIEVNMYVPSTEMVESPILFFNGFTAPYYTLTEGYCTVRIPATSFAQEFGVEDITSVSSLTFSFCQENCSGQFKVLIKNLIGVDLDGQTVDPIENQVVNFADKTISQNAVVSGATGTWELLPDGKDVNDTALAVRTAEGWYPSIDVTFPAVDLTGYDFVSINMYIPSVAMVPSPLIFFNGLSAPYYELTVGENTITIPASMFAEEFGATDLTEVTSLNMRLCIENVSSMFTVYFTNIVGVDIEAQTPDALENGVANFADKSVVEDAEASGVSVGWAMIPNGVDVNDMALKVVANADSWYPSLDLNFAGVDVTVYDYVEINLYVPSVANVPSPFIFFNGLTAPSYAITAGHTSIRILSSMFVEEFGTEDLTALTKIPMRLCVENISGEFVVYIKNVVGGNIEHVVDNAVVDFAAKSHQAATLGNAPIVPGNATAKVVMLPDESQEALKLSNGQDSTYLYVKFTFPAVDISGYEKIVLNMYVPEGMVAPLVCLGGILAAPWYSTSNGYCSVEIPVTEIARVYPMADLTAFTWFEIRLSLEGNTNIAAGALSVYFMNVVGVEAEEVEEVLENVVANYTLESYQTETLTATDAVLLATAEVATVPGRRQEALKMSNAQDQLYPYFKFTFPAVDISAYEKIVLNMYVPEGIVAPLVCLGGGLAAPWYSTSNGYCSVEIPVSEISRVYPTADLTAFTSFEIRLAFDGNTNIAAGALSVYFLNVVGA